MNKEQLTLSLTKGEPSSWSSVSSFTPLCRRIPVSTIAQYWHCEQGILLVVLIIISTRLVNYEEPVGFRKVNVDALAKFTTNVKRVIKESVGF